MKRIAFLISMVIVLYTSSSFSSSSSIDCEWFANTSSNCWNDFVKAAEQCSWQLDQIGYMNDRGNMCSYQDFKAVFDIPMNSDVNNLKKISEYTLIKDDKVCLSYKDTGMNFVAISPMGTFKMKVLPISEMLEIECPDGMSYSLPYKTYADCPEKNKPGLSFIVSPDEDHEHIFIGFKSNPMNINQFINCRTPASRSE